MVAFFTLFALALVLGGPALAYFHAVSPEIAVGMSLTGLALLSLLFLVTVVKFFRRNFSNWATFALGPFAIAALGALGYFGTLNPLHDVSTDLKNPPSFKHPAYPFAVRAGSEYLNESFRLNREFNPLHAAKQREIYPTIVPDPVKVPPKDAYETILRTIPSQFPTWNIVLHDEAEHRIEAEAKDPAFGMITDVVIEVRGDLEQGQCTVEMRSRLRTVLPDLGWDAYVLRNLRAQIDLALGPIEKRLQTSEPLTPAAPAVKAPPTKETPKK